MNPEDPMNVTYSALEIAQGLFTMTAIPLALFALWGEYYKKFILSLAPGELNEIRDNEIRQIRTVGLFTVIAQISAQLVAITVFKPSLWASYAAFLSAAILHARMQLSIEETVRPRKTGEQSPLWMAFKALFWTLSNIVLCWIASLILIAAILLVAPQSIIQASVFPHLLLLVAFVGFYGGLYCSAWIAPLAIKNIVPCEEITQGTEFEGVVGFFKKSGAPIPRVFRLKNSEHGPHNALMSGIPSGTKSFQPSLFISESLFQKLSVEELGAVLLHEASHLRLGHITRNLNSLFAYYLGFAVISAAISFLVAKGQVRESYAFFDVAVAFFPFFGSLILSRFKTRSNEFEADRFAVETLGADPVHLIGALEKLEGLNNATRIAALSEDTPEMDNLSPASTPPSASSAGLLATHPLIQARIQRLKTMKPGVEKSDSFQAKAA